MGNRPVRSVEDTLYGIRLRCDARREGKPGAFLSPADDASASSRMAVTMEQS